jgi:hypothetical protein
MIKDKIAKNATLKRQKTRKITGNVRIVTSIWQTETTPERLSRLWTGRAL